MNQIRKGFLASLSASIAAPFLGTSALAANEFQPGSQPTPIGTIVAFAGPGPGDAAWERSAGFYLCDGRSLNRKMSPNQALFSAIGSSWGGDGVNQFNLPDLRGLFLRGVDGGAGRDPDAGSRTANHPGGHAGDQTGTMESDEFRSHNHPGSVINPADHTHTYREPGGGGGSEAPGNEGLGNATTGSTHLDVSIAAQGGTETRPRNASVYWIIRYK